MRLGQLPLALLCREQPGDCETEDYVVSDPSFFYPLGLVLQGLVPECVAVARLVVHGVAAVAAIATTVARWTVGDATTANVTITKIADDRTPGIGCQAGAASATNATTAATTTGTGGHLPAPAMAAAARHGRGVGASSRHATTRRVSSTSRALRRWPLRPCTTRVHGAMSPSDGITSPRV